jgi:hypothetical protein
MLAAVTTAGDQAQIENDKDSFRKNTKTAQLVATGELADVLPLTPALKIRYELTPVTIDDFTRNVNVLLNKPETWKTRAVIGFAKTEMERDALRKLIKSATADEKYKELLFIDAASTPLGHDNFEQYVDYMANGKYNRGKDNHLADEMDTKAKLVLTAWRTAIHGNKFVLYCFANQTGTVAANGQALVGELTGVAVNKYPQGFDAAVVTETMFVPSNLKVGAECGVREITRGSFTRVEKVLGSAWQCADYWTNQSSLPVSKIKVAVDRLIKDEFDQNGRISIRDIFDALSAAPYGFMPCNLSAFLTGFLLKEYAKEAYRYSDGQVNEPLDPDKLKEMIDECIKLKHTPNPRYKEKYIVLMTPEEREFCRLTEQTFRIPQNQCSSVEVTTRMIRNKMKELGFPLWCLKAIDDQGLSDFIDKLFELVNPSNERGVGQLAIEIGKMSLVKPTAGDILATLFTKEKCLLGMRRFLETFEGGEALRLAKEIDAENEILNDVRNRFDASEALWLWDKQTGEDRIRELILDYAIVARSNLINSKKRSLKLCLSEWHNRLTFLKMPCDALKTDMPDVEKLLALLHDIARNGDLATDKRQPFHDALVSNADAIKTLLNDPLKAFKRVYAPYLEGLNDVEVTDVNGSLPNGMFVREKTVCNQLVDERVQELRRAQARTKLRTLWNDKTGSKTPRDWSQMHRTPILCMVPAAEFEAAKRAFDTVNRGNPEDAEIKFASEFLQKATFLSGLADEATRDQLFARNVMAAYTAMLPPVNKVRTLLEERLPLETYDWYPSPEVERRLKTEAEKHYNAGGSDKVLAKIDKMENSKLRTYLKRLVTENMTVGIEIIADDKE